MCVCVCVCVCVCSKGVRECMHVRNGLNVTFSELLHAPVLLQKCPSHA